MSRKNQKMRNTMDIPIFLIAIFNLLIIILLAIYILYLRFIPYTIITYDGYGVSSKEITNNLLSKELEGETSIKAIKVSDQDEIFKNLKSYYVGASKQNIINLDFPIYVNDSLALYNLSPDITLITNKFQETEGYSGITLSSGALYNAGTLERADYLDYILIKNKDNIYINSKEIDIQTSINKYKIPLNSIVNFSNDFISYYNLKGDEFVYNKISDIDENSIIYINDYNMSCTYKEFLVGLNIIKPSKTYDQITDLEPNEKIIEKSEDTKIYEDSEIKNVKENITEKSEDKDDDQEKKVDEEKSQTPNQLENNNTSKEENKKDNEQNLDKEQNEEKKEDEKQEENQEEEKQQEEKQDDKKNEQEGEKQDNKEKEQEEEKQEDKEQEQEEEKQDDKENEQEEEKPEVKPYNPTEVKWIKPTVTCEEFVANVYSAKTNVTITDPSRVIAKAVTFAFYKDDKIALRISANSSGEAKAIRLLPNTKYKIIGTYQYKDQQGNLIENRCLEQEIQTSNTDKINPIELEIEKGQVYPTKIELKNIAIVSDINDEALNGVQSAQVLINGNKFLINTNLLRNLLKGEGILYRSLENIEPNQKCNYEIVFIDTAGNKMKMKNNQGSTVTSKQIPKVNIKVSSQEVISVNVNLDLVNENNIELKNYRYILYDTTGNVHKEESLTTKDKNIKFTDLNPQNTYTIKIYADYDIEDGNGIQQNQEIGTATFTTFEISKLGSIKMQLDYEEDDLKFDSLKLNALININKTDSRLLQILKSINIELQDKDGRIVKHKDFEDIEKLKNEPGEVVNFENLNSNTTYYIVINAVAVQGSTESKVNTTYTLQSFTTKKKPAELNITNLIVTNNLIDMDIYVEDKDGACLENIVAIKLTDMFGKEYIPEIESENIKKAEQIPTNQSLRITYKDLRENETYNLTCVVGIYNETRENSKIQNNHQIFKKQFITSGLGGKLDLIGMDKDSELYKNLINVKSEVNWYSKCFDVMKKQYVINEEMRSELKIGAKYNYEKTYNESENSLRFLSNQCYVYDLSKYKGREITISFLGKTTKENAKIYIQKGKNIGENIEKIDGFMANNWTRYEKTLVVPESGYVGFYLEDYKEIDETTQEEISVDYYFEVKNLQAELGTEATDYSQFNYKLYANFKVDFIDSKKVTYDSNTNSCKYYIRLISNNTDTREFDYIYDQDDNIEEWYSYLIDESNVQDRYIAELIIKQNGREYVLSRVEFEYIPEKCTEIKSITTVQEFKEIQPYGNYIILKDLDLTNAKTENEYTFGNPNISFYGSIDFNGKTVKKDTYSLNRKKDVTSYVFYKLDSSSNLKNIVIDYYINNQTNRFTLRVEGRDEYFDEKDGLYSLFLYNEAKIDNVIVNLKQATQKQRIYVGLLGFRNSGTIENFIVNFEKTLYGSKYMAGLCLYSDGIIQNGYLYGLGIEAIDEIAISDYRNIAGVVYQVDGNGLLQNIYNTTGITVNHSDSTYSYVANIVYNLGYPTVIDETSGAIISSVDSTAKVRDVYSVQPLYTVYRNLPYYNLLNSNNNEVNKGPNILNTYTNTTVTGSRYFCDITYEDVSYNTKTPATSLYEPAVQDLMLNTNGFRQFVIDQFVSNGYYPHLKLNSCMPKQENIRIDLTGTDFIDVLSGREIENNDISKLELSEKLRNDIEKYIEDNKINLNDENVKITEFRIYNPGGTTITEVGLNYLTSGIMAQSYNKKVSTVYVLLSKPSSYLNYYTVNIIKGKMANGRETVSKYGEETDLGTRSIDVKFVKYISNAEEWYNINNNDENDISGLTQNYRLISDINFANSDVSPYIDGIFEGSLDGEYNGKIHTLSNISGSQPLFVGIDKATIKNINIDKISISSSEQKVGLIGNCESTENIVLDNIHIKDMEITSSYGSNNPYIGGILPYVDSSRTARTDTLIIQNCGITNLSVEFENQNVTDAMVGGIIGYIYTFGGVDTYINNNYVQNLFIDANVTSTSGIGGVVGYKNHGTDQLYKQGEPHFYIENCYTTGKINTKIKAGGILGNSHFENCYVRKCFSTVNLNSNLTSGAVYLGGIVGTHDGGASYVTNNLYMGNIYVSGNNLPNENRILGSASNTNNNKNYAYKDQLINGEILTSALGATKLLTYDEIFSKNTFENLLEFDDNYAYKIINSQGENFDLLANEYLPQLNDTNKKLQPYQKLVSLDNDLKLDSILSTPSADKTKVTVLMKFENPKDLNITGVKIENEDMVVDMNTWNTFKDDKGLTNVTFVATPNRAYDSYKIESIFYERNGQVNEKEITTKIKVELFKGISNAREWNEFFLEEGRTYPGQNIKILGNIDFSTVDHIESKVVVGRIEADSVQIFSNINLSLGASNGFINEVRTSLKNLNFENCQITGKGSYIGLIGILRGEASNCNFDNITIDCTGNYDYIGIISRAISASFKNININKIICKGRHYVGGLCGQTTSLGQSSNLKGTYLQITTTGNYAGGIFGATQGKISNISAYQYSEDGTNETGTETAYLVSGRSIVGGAIGQYSAGNNTLSTIKVTNSTIKGTANVGGNVGYNSGNGNGYVSINNKIINTGDNSGGNVGQHSGWTITNATSEKNTITGKQNVGGNWGRTNWAGSNKIYSINNTIEGTNQVGGNIGYATYYNVVPNELRVSGTTTTIKGTNYVGGSVGRSVCRIRNIKVEDAKVEGTGGSIGGIIGRQEYTNPSVSETSNANYSIAGAYVKGTRIKGVSNYVGGIAGYTVGTIYGVVVDNCTISSDANNVGGIAGYYTGYSGTTGSQISESSYKLFHSYCVNSSVEANNYAGGIVGEFKYGNIQYCYVGNSNIKSKNNGAGGLVGYFDNSKLSNLQYKATIKYNFIANTEENKILTGKNSVGGVIGTVAKNLNYDEEVEYYNNVECNLIVTDIVCTGTTCSMGIGSIANKTSGISQAKYMNNIYVYNCSCINNNQVGGISNEKTSYNLISSTDLSKNATYLKNDKILDEEGNLVGNKGLNFGNARYNYTTGYFPILKEKYSSADTYWRNTVLNVIQDKIAIPNRTENFTRGNLTTNSLMLRNMSLTSVSANIPLPDVYVYAVDVDKINIEFSEIKSNTYFSLSADETIIERQLVTNRIYTIKYDFTKPLNLNMYNANYNDEKIIHPNEVSNLLSVQEDEYFTLDNMKIKSNKREIAGEFVNLYGSKAMNKDGYVYDLKEDKISEDITNIELLEKTIPISRFSYEGQNIETYYHCSKVGTDENNMLVKNQQIFIKNGNMYLIDGEFKNKGDAVIIDSYNDELYEVTLGTDGVIYDLLSKINYPEDFINKNIVAMNNNLNNDSNILVVLYESGRVYGFNYFNGQKIYDSNISNEKVGLLEYVAQNFKLDNVTYKLAETNYKAALDLADKLDEISVDEAIKKVNDQDTEVKDDLNNETSDFKEEAKNNTQNNSNTMVQENLQNANEENLQNNSELTNKDKIQYVTSYNPRSDRYEVYSTSEIFGASENRLLSENDRIEANEKLKLFYSSYSIGNDSMKNIGIIIIGSILGSVCVILMVMLKKKV